MDLLTQISHDSADAARWRAFLYRANLPRNATVQDALAKIGKQPKHSRLLRWFGLLRWAQ